MLVTIFVLGIVLAFATAITIRFHWKQENSILTSFLGIGFLLYVFGLVNLMRIGIYVIIVGAILCLAYDIVKVIQKKITIKEIFTFGTLLYILLLVMTTLLLKNTYYTEWDEFSHWGSNLKAMVANDVFWSNKVYDGVHVVYQPLAGIYEYFFCKLNGGFAEDISYIGITTFMITLLLPLFRHLEYKEKDMLKGFLIIFCVYCLIYIFGFRLASLYIDLLLAILFASSMIYAYLRTEKEDKIIIVMLLVAMVLLKDTGLLLAGIVLLQLFIKDILYPVIEQKKIKKENVKAFGILCLILLILLTSYMTWKIYCKANGKVLDDRHDKNAIVEINIKQYIKGILQVGERNEKIDTIAKKFYQALNGDTLISSPICKTAIQLVVCSNLFAILLYYLAGDKEQRKKIISITVAMDIGFILYCMLLMATYMFAFTETEGRTLASYARYMNTYFMAWMVMLIGMIQSSKKEKEFLFIGITSLWCLSTVNIYSIVHPVSKNVTAVTDNIAKKAEIIQKYVEDDEKVYLIFQNIGASVNFHLLHYAVSPIVTNLLYEWNLGEPYFEGDIWTYDITVEEWEQKLIDEAYDYVFIAKADERLEKEYGSLFAEGTDFNNLENHLFAVVANGENSVELQFYQ